MFYDKELYRYENKLFSFSNNSSKLDYSYKSFLLNNNSVDFLKDVDRVERQLNINDCYNSFQLRNWLYNSIGCCGVLESIRIQNAYYHKLSRLQKRINRILDTDFICCFITFTFDEKHYNKSTDESKRKYVRRWLKQYCNDYVANIDYGGKNGRLHFHAVVSLKNIIDHKTWKYGALNFKRINNKNDLQLSKYVNKLSFHALKESSKRQVLIYKKLK